MSVTAILGGNPTRSRPIDGTEHYGSPGDQGSGDVRRLVDAIRKGGIERVFVLSRWGSHGATAKVKEACRNHKVPCIVWPRGLGALAAELGKAA
jgi:hypothetical protein